LSQHLERHHPTEYSEIQANTDSSDEQPAQCSSKRSGLQTIITDTFPSVEPNCKYNPRHKACEGVLTNFLCLDLQPLSIVSSPPFLQLPKTLDPKFTPASTSHFTRVVIPNLYEHTKSKVKDSLHKADYLSCMVWLSQSFIYLSYCSLCRSYIEFEALLSPGSRNY